MFERAISTGADATIPEIVFYHEDEPGKNTTLSAPNGDKGTNLTNREAVMLSLDWSIPGNALYASRLVKQVESYEFSMNADDYTVRVLFFHCNKVAFSGGTFYYRQDNADAVTKKFSAGIFDFPYTDFKLFEFLRDHEFPVGAQESVLLRSIDAVSDLRYILSIYRLKGLIGRRTDSSFNVEDAERRIRRCYDAMRSGNAAAHLSGVKPGRRLLIRVKLTHYAFFCAYCFFAIGARRAWSKMRGTVRGR